MAESTSKTARKSGVDKSKATGGSDASDAKTEDKTEDKAEFQSNFSGPGTGVEAPADDQQGRYPTTIVNSDVAPLDPPEDAHTQVDPPAGYNLSSTDDVYGQAAAGRTIAGEDHVGLVDKDGGSVDADSAFDVEDGKTFGIASKRVYEEFLYPGTTQVARRLLFTEGQRVSLQQIARFKEAVATAPEPAQQRSAAGDGPDQDVEK